MRSLARIAISVAGVAALAACGSLELKQGPGGSRVFAIERSWARDTVRAEYLGFRRVHRMSPLIASRLVIAGNSIDGLSAFDRTSGREVWRFNAKGGVEGGAVADADRVYFGANDGVVYALRTSDGATVWTFQARAESLAPPTIDGTTVFVQTGSDTLFALDSASGKLLWTYNRQTASNFSIRANARPTVDADLVYTGFSDGFVAAIRKRDGGLAWERKIGFAPRFRDVDSTPVIEGDSLYVSSFDGALHALDKRSGEPLWQLDEGGYAAATLGPDNALYYSTTSAKLIRLDRRSGKPVWTRVLERGIGTQPVFYKGYLLVGEADGPMRAFDSNTGASIARFEPGHGLLAKPTVVESTGETYVMSSGANLYALKIGMVRRGDRLPWEPEP